VVSHVEQPFTSIATWLLSARLGIRSTRRAVTQLVEHMESDTLAFTIVVMILEGSAGSDE